MKKEQEPFKRTKGDLKGKSSIFIKEILSVKYKTKWICLQRRIDRKKERISELEEVIEKIAQNKA